MGSYEDGVKGNPGGGGSSCSCLITDVVMMGGRSKRHHLNWPSTHTHTLFLFLLAIFGTNLLTYLLVSSGGGAADRRQPAAMEAARRRRIDDTAALGAGAAVAAEQRGLVPWRRLEEELRQTKAELAATRGALEQTQRDVREAVEQHLAVGGSGERSWWWEAKGGRGGGGGELAAYVARRKLPLGWSAGLASDSIVSPIGHACAAKENAEDLQRFMDYTVGGQCPDDQNLAQRLLLHGCEPLPRRRCFARVPENFSEPYALPEGQWAMPRDENVRWAAYSCKSFGCLNGRKNRAGASGDCLDCFELEGREKGRWMGGGNPAIDFTISEVLALKGGGGGIRIGLDIGGGTGSFAVRMKEHNVTVVTTSLNFDGPFNNMIALRGVVPIYMSISQRFPFFDNTLDIVHSMHVLSHWIPADAFEFILFDIDRILRPGGLLWLDRFFCVRHQLDDTYVPLIDRLRYRRLRWAVRDKLDKGAHRREVYLSAVLEKPYLSSSAADDRPEAETAAPPPNNHL